MPRNLTFALLLLAGLLSLPAHGADSAVTHRAMEILRGNCLSCHNAEKKKGGLLLATREGALTGGDNGVALNATKPEESPLLKLLVADADPHMPPKKQLTDEQLATLHEWARDGATWDEKALAEMASPVRDVHFAPLPASYQPALALALAPDEKHLAVARGNRVQIHDLAQTNRPVSVTLTEAHDAIEKLAWSKDGRWLAAGDFRRVLVWNAQTFQLALMLTNDLVSRVTALDFTPDSARIVAADGVPSKSGVLHVWKVADGAFLTSWPAHKDSVLDLEISHNGKRVATGSADKLVKVWNLESHEEIAKMEGHLGHVMAVAFNTNDTQVCSAGADREIKIWDVQTREKLINAGRNNSRINDLVWTVDGSHIVAVGDDGKPRKFSEFKAHNGAESSEGARERSLSEVDDVLYAVAVSADGKTVYAAGHEGCVYIWTREEKSPVRLCAPEPAKAVADNHPGN